MRRAGRFVPFVVSVALLVWIAARFEGWDLLARVDAGTLALALAVALFIDTTVGAFKWWSVVRLSRIDASFGAIWKLWVGLNPIAAVSPFQSGHALYVLALRNDQRVSTFRALECVAYDKGLSLVGTFGLIGVGQLVIPTEHPLHHPLILAGSLLVVTLFFGDRVLFQLLGRFRWFRDRSQLLRVPVPLRHKLWLLPLAMVYQSSDTISMYLGCLALGVALPPELVFGAFPIILLLTYAPVSISGFGVREGLIVFFLSGSLAFDEAVGAGLLVAVLEYVAPAVFGVVVLPHVLRVLWRLRRIAANAPPPREDEPKAALSEPDMGEGGSPREARGRPSGGGSA